MGRKSRQHLLLGLAAIPIGSCTAAPSHAVIPHTAPVCQSANGLDAPGCLLPGSYGRILIKDDQRGLRVYEHCVHGKVAPNWIVFEVPGAAYDYPTSLSVLEPLRERLSRSVEKLAVVNLEPCSWDQPSVSCIRVETTHATREVRLGLAPTVYDAIRDERDRAGRASTCVPVAITPWSGPILASRAGVSAPP